MADTGLSKAAKKNKKKNERKKKAKGGSASAVQKPLTPADLLPILKEQLEEAKAAKDITLASMLREQVWVLKDLVKGVKTDMPKKELQPIMEKLAALMQVHQPEPEPEPPRLGSGLDAEKRIRNLRKKLASIEQLKERQTKGETLEKSQLAKIESEEEVNTELEDLERLLQVALAGLGQ